MERFGDPGFLFHKAMAKIWGLITLRLADSRILPFNHIDQASAVLVNQQKALPGTVLTCNLAPGEDKFKGLYPSVDWEHQLNYAQKLGLGTREYKLIKLKTLAYKS